MFFSGDTAPAELYTLSLHDALPIWLRAQGCQPRGAAAGDPLGRRRSEILLRTGDDRADRKSTRLNSSHVAISYAVFCLKKKKLIAKTRYLITAASVAARSAAIRARL